MSTPEGLGRPRGPQFVSPELPRYAAFPPGAGGEPDRGGEPGRWGGRVVVAVVVLLVAAGIVGIVAGLGGGGASPGAGQPPTARATRTPGGMADVAAAVLPGVVSVEVRRDGDTLVSGSGFVIDARGYLITNSHLLREAVAVTVIAHTGQRVGATVIGRDEGADIAVLHVAALRLPPLRLGVSSSARIGEPVLAVGAPLGASGAVTAGIISALNREVRLGTARQSAIQIDASVNAGNSGGPLVNARAEVIGVNTAIAAVDDSGSAGTGFAIPIEHAASVADRLINR